MDFYARQEAARRTTRWLLVAFLISVVLVVLAVDAVVAFAMSAADPTRVAHACGRSAAAS
jgi:hypothetical protein